MGEPWCFDAAAENAAVAAYAKTGAKVAAADAGGVTLRTIQNHLKADPAFAERMLHAKAQYVHMLATEAERRAVEGVDRVKMVGTGADAEIVHERHYSDGIMLRLLERHDKAYRKGEVIEQETKHSGAIGLDKLSAAGRAKLRDVLEESEADGG
jgi:hypothetical protein